MWQNRSVQIDSLPRDRLRHLDAILTDLEELNLKDLTGLPVALGSALIDLGIDDAYALSITELIDRIFDMQSPILAAVRSRSTRGRALKAGGFGRKGEPSYPLISA